MMMAFNYPKHPLFGISPLLDKGFQTVRFDPYEQVLVAKIRAGKYASDLWDCNGFYLNYGDRLAAPADLQLRAAKSPYKMTAEQLKEYRDRVRAQWEAEAPERERRAKERAAEEEKRAAELNRIRREWAERQARKEAEEKQRDHEWEEATLAAKAKKDRWEEAMRAWQEARPVFGATLSTRQQERDAILRSSWECSGCLKPAVIVPVPEGAYQLTCPRCVRSVTADHATLLAMTKARNGQPQPANTG